MDHSSPCFVTDLLYDTNMIFVWMSYWYFMTLCNTTSVYVVPYK